MKKYEIPPHARRTNAPVFRYYCEHCHSYEWALWYDVPFLTQNGKARNHQFPVCVNCHRINERESYMMDLLQIRPTVLE